MNLPVTEERAAFLLAIFLAAVVFEGLAHPFVFFL
jgi:hypothetical protein